MDTVLTIAAIALPLIELLGILAAVHAVMNARTSQGAAAWAIALVTRTVRMKMSMSPSVTPLTP